MNDLDREILRLSDLYYSCIASTSHSETDCVFSIKKSFEFGRDIRYAVYHQGSLNKIEYSEFSTYEEAQQFLISELRRLLTRQNKLAHDRPDGLGGMSKEEAERIISITGEFV